MKTAGSRLPIRDIVFTMFIARFGRQVQWTSWRNAISLKVRGFSGPFYNSNEVHAGHHIHFSSFYSLYWSSVYAWHIVLINSSDSLILSLKFAAPANDVLHKWGVFNGVLLYLTAIVIYTCA